MRTEIRRQPKRINLSNPRILRHQKNNTEEIAESMVIGAVTDLLQEIKELRKTIRKNEYNKDKCTSIFRLLLARYHPFIGNDYKEIIILFIYDVSKNHFTYDLHPKEIETWWP